MFRFEELPNANQYFARMITKAAPSKIAFTEWALVYCHNSYILGF
jgi:hypothetical protein